MAEKQTFTAVLEKHAKLDATGIVIPFDVEKVFGAKRVAVKALINDVEYRGSIVSMGGRYLLGIPKAVREAAGVNAGEKVVINIEKDIEERTIVLPNDLAAGLEKKGLIGNWDRLSYTHRKEQVRSIEEAKQPETRQRRIEKAVAMAAAKK